jgi:hypothetical protein
MSPCCLLRGCCVCARPGCQEPRGAVAKDGTPLAEWLRCRRACRCSRLLFPQLGQEAPPGAPTGRKPCESIAVTPVLTSTTSHSTSEEARDLPFAAATTTSTCRPGPWAVVQRESARVKEHRASIKPKILEVVASGEDSRVWGLRRRSGGAHARAAQGTGGQRG